MTRHPLLPGFGDAGVPETLAALARLPAFATPPVTLDLDGTVQTSSGDWARALVAARETARADWAPDEDSPRRRRWIQVTPAQGWVYASIPDAFATVDEAVALVESLPFEVMSFGSVWLSEWRAADFDPISFGDGHRAHGWGCAFRGAGHDRLVSRRWIDHGGPWRVHRRPGDLTILQFHDLAADAEHALAEAAPCHRAIGVTPEGGYLGRIADYGFSGDVSGLYDAERRTLEIVVPPGSTVDPVRMRDACALRAQHRANPPADQPILQVAFVFLLESDARAHLPALWRRELECWLADDRPRRRLDGEVLG